MNHGEGGLVDGGIGEERGRDWEERKEEKLKLRCK